MAFPFSTLRVDFSASVEDAFYLAEFSIPAGGDVDARCTCKFLEFRDGAAIFAWVEGCPVHRTTPRVPLPPLLEAR